MTTTHLLFLLACAGHLVLWRCDWNLTYLAGGRFDFRCLQDNDRLSAVLGGTPLKQPMGATMAGVFALTAAFPGYLALCRWMEAFSPLCAGLMLAGCVLFFLPGMAHHVFCGAVEWFYLRLGRTEEAREVIVDFFKGTSATMFLCYLGLLLFTVSLFVAVVSGGTSLPRWACLCNTLPLFLLLSPLRIVGTMNLVSAVLFLGLFVLI